MSNPISAFPAAAGARTWHGLSLAWQRAALDDRMLRDIGIDRADIERAARDGRGAGAWRHRSGAGVPHPYY